jgi:hypothetical protein
MRQPSCTHALPDISILESYPTPELGFDIDSQHEPNGLRELRNNKLYAFELPDK